MAKHGSRAVQKDLNIAKIAFLSQRGSLRVGGSQNQPKATIITEMAHIYVLAKYILCHDIVMYACAFLLLIYY